MCQLIDISIITSTFIAQRNVFMRSLGVFYLTKQSGNFRGKCPSVKNVLHLSQVPFVLSPSYFPPNFKMAVQMLILNEIVELSVEEESPFNSEDDDTPIIAAVATHLRRNFHRNCLFCFENIYCHYLRSMNLKATSG